MTIANIVLAALGNMINIVGSYYLQSIIIYRTRSDAFDAGELFLLGWVIVCILQQVLSYAQEYLLLYFGATLVD